ncbi:efflux RND transporter permease subunit [Telmatospirillum sp. J64-1]|uniref:efflux RND transporter permease subunit n=1 Tax=Telmatospirillum sp. J64-1 TaxID=2502183 RepID=UPI00115E40EB|nr:efflux RND transporter permease subunit [Telmatospirillum sp. J64-1]
MNTLIAAAFARSRVAVLMLLLLLVSGMFAYITIPKEANPEIEIPIFFVNVAYPGISAEDSDRLLVRPLQRELQGITGLREMRSQAGEGFALIQLEFDPGYDNDQALSDVREQVDLATPDLPPGAEAPVVREVDLSLFPVLTAMLSGSVEERSLISIARNLRDQLEGLPGVLEVDIVGDREDLMEILVDPLAIESYRLSYEEVMQAVQNNNQLVAAGAFDTGAGRISVTVPGVIQDISDVLDIPVHVTNGTVVRMQDVAMVRQTFHDPESFARINGQPAIALEIRKTTGANIIDTVAEARALIDAAAEDWPADITVTYMQDQAEDVENLLGDLENNVFSAILLVVLTLILVLGIRASLLVGVAIPGSFLTGILTIWILGFTLNIVVLFALILVIGMLVDGAIVVVELAERQRAEGMERREAYLKAAQRMAWPITASTATTLAVFLPLLFWPGVAGQFMLYLPATVLVTLLASLIMALVFVPVLGGLSRRKDAGDRPASSEESGVGGLVGPYLRLLRMLIAHPALTLAGTAAILFVTYGAYGVLGRGVDFFPQVEPEFAQVQVQARGDLSIWEADQLVRMVENQLIGQPQVTTVYARTIGSTEARLESDLPEDVIGIIQLEFTDWRRREPASRIIQGLRARLDELPGLLIQIREQERGPGEGRPIQVEIAAREPERLAPAVEEVRETIAQLGGFIDVIDDRPQPSIEVRLSVNREEAARYGADVAGLGAAVQLLTDGILLGNYRPDFTDEEVEIRLRFPSDERTLGQMANLRITTPRGLVPISNFVEFYPAPAPGIITRVDGRRVYNVEADVPPGTLVDERISALEAALAQRDMEGIDIRFRGQAEDQAEAGNFLLMAFAFAIFLMFMILVTQFNSFFQSLLVLSAIVFSTAGVLMGLLIRQEAFSVVMSGIGVVALAGIIVNNNIVLIDTYNEMRRKGLAPADAALETGAQRLRPVLLTAITTIIGLMPMVLALTLDFSGRDLYFGAPSTQYWVQLSTAIVGGLVFGTVLTLLFTPAMLSWFDNRRVRK